MSDKFASRVIPLIKTPVPLPVENPSVSFWQLPPHKSVSTAQSAILPTTTDVAVIGSGITGCSVTKYLLDNDPSCKVVVFEARNVASGGTGRNGGHLITNAKYEFADKAKMYGWDHAVEIARFGNATVARVREAVAEYDEDLKDVSEIRDVVTVTVFEDAESFATAVESLSMYARAFPELKGTFEIVNDVNRLRNELHLKRAVGACLHQSGAMWPYRLITGIFERLLAKYPSRISIESNTPVTNVSYSPSASQPFHPYIISTPRGDVRVAKVMHCTNGFSAHLLPKLTGSIFPWRGTVSTQARTPLFPNVGSHRSWEFLETGSYDEESGEYDTALYYMQQNAKTGDIFLGGEKQVLEAMLIADDSYGTISPKERHNICTMLPKLFNTGWEDGKDPEIRQVWSGIMGFTSDGMPLVGRLTPAMTGRAGGEEFISAGFNGYGMDKCWLAGECLARIALGENVDGVLPRLYQVSDKRWRERLRPEYAPEWLKLVAGMPSKHAEEMLASQSISPQL